MVLEEPEDVADGPSMAPKRTFGAIQASAVQAGQVRPAQQPPRRDETLRTVAKEFESVGAVGVGSASAACVGGSTTVRHGSAARTVTGEIDSDGQHCSSTERCYSGARRGVLFLN